MRTIFRKLRARKFSYERLIQVIIHRDALLYNLRAFKERYHTPIAPVLKSNAYGHGLIEVARIIEKESLPFISLDSFFEAVVLRNEKIKTPIVIIGYSPLENMVGNNLSDVAFAILSVDELKRLTKSKIRITIHLKIDTGMHRHGIVEKDLDEAFKILKDNPYIKLDGVFSHFADADIQDSLFTKLQIERWNNLVSRIKKMFPETRYFHIAQTAGSFYSSNLNANVIRLGIGLYGIHSGLETMELHPVLEIKTRVTTLRKLEAGEYIGYNATYKTEKEMNIASIPMGYREGIDRRLSNKGFVLIKNIPCPILGRVSMNITSLDVSHIPDISIDDEVTVISRDPKSQASIETISTISGAIPYELLVHVPEGLQRTVL